MYLFPESLEHLFIAISVCMGEITEREREREDERLISVLVCVFMVVLDVDGGEKWLKTCFIQCALDSTGEETQEFLGWECERVEEKNNSRSSLFHLVFSPSSLSPVSSVCPSTLASFIHWFNLYIAFSIGYGIVFSAHMHVLLHQKKN